MANARIGMSLFDGVEELDLAGRRGSELGKLEG